MMNNFFNWWFWPFAAVGMLIAVIILILLLAFWIWMIVDCAKRNFKNNTEKIIWIVIIGIIGWMGALVYYIVIRTINKKGIWKK